MDNEKDKFQKELLDFAKSFERVKQFDNYKNVKEFATEVMHLNDKFEKALEKIKSFNEREVLFK